MYTWALWVHFAQTRTMIVYFGTHYCQLSQKPLHWDIMDSSPPFNPSIPFDSLPHIPPPDSEYQTVELLRLEARARAAVSELKGYANTIPNQAILINAIVLREAKDSSEIENIVTTQDELYRAVASGAGGAADPEAKEVLRYREALWCGFRKVEQRGILTIPDIIEIQAIIVENNAGIRRTPGTALVNDRTSETVYTPPQDEHRIQNLLSNLAEYLNGDDDSLLKSGIIHYQFESIHPFYDGNGRTGRIINVLYLVLKGHLDIPILYLSSFFIERRPDYYHLLRGVTAESAWKPWLSFYLTAVETTARQTIRTVRRIKEQLDITVELVRKELPRIYSRELVETLFEHPYCKTSFVEQNVGVERKAASRYLHQIEEIGVLELQKIGRENIYINRELMRLLADAT